MADLSRGFGSLLDRIEFPKPLVALLPSTVDRFLEARFFAKEASSIQPCSESIQVVNWHVSACIAAVIAVRDAGQTDFEKLGRPTEFADSVLAQEFYLSSTVADPNFRDPLAVNRAYWDLRNLRVHYAIPLVELRTRVLEEDIADNPAVFPDAGAPRWFLRPLMESEQRLLKRPQVLREELEKFNLWVDTRPMQAVLSQHLVMLASAVTRTSRALAA
jgi:hypothetical protein